MKSIRHESTEQQQHLFSIAAIMAHKSAVVGQQQQHHQQKQLHGKTNCVFRLPCDTFGIYLVDQMNPTK